MPPQREDSRRGEIRSHALEHAAEMECRAAWKFHEGDPMNSPYIDDNLRAVLKYPLRGTSHSR
jgi:hypothetical protein